MIGDCAILGIEETDDLSKIKAAFRKKMKELHPDLSREEDSVGRHILFVEVQRAYQRLRGGQREKTVRPTTAVPPRAAGGKQLAVHADPAYVFYKNGMKYFMLIHPSQWNLETPQRLNTLIAGHEKEQEAIRQKVMNLVRLFPRAYYYFSIVVHEYPDSAWAADAGEKMKVIEERTLRYKKIIESFSIWNADKKESVRKFHDKYGAGKPGKSIINDIRDKWDKH